MADRYLVSRSNPGRPISMQDVEEQYRNDPRVAHMTPEQRFDWYKAEIQKKGYDYFEPEQESILLRAAKNLVPSALNMIGGVAEGLYTAATEPKKTGLAIVGTLSGQDIPYRDSDTGQYEVMPGSKMQRAFVDAMKKRYGNLGETFAEDPAGVLSDASVLLAPALGASAKLAQSARFAKTASALSKAADAARMMDATTAAATVTGKAVSGPARWAAYHAFQSMYRPEASMGSERINAAMRMMWDKSIAPSEKGLKSLFDILKSDSDARAIAAAQYDADGNPGILLGEVINPPNRVGMDQLWDEAGRNFGKVAEQRQGYVHGSRQFVEDASAGQATIPDPQNYHAPSPGIFHPQSRGAVPPTTLTEANEARMAFNRNLEIWKKDAQGKLETATTASMAKDRAIKQLHDNLRDVFYEKLESAGINPPSVDGKQLTWREFGKRDKALSDAAEIITRTMAQNAANQGILGRGFGPYYLSVASSSIGGGMTWLLTGDAKAGVSAAALVLAASMFGKSKPDAAAKILRATDRLQMSPQAWRIAADSLRTLVSAPANVKRRIGPELPVMIDMMEQRAAQAETAGGQQNGQTQVKADPHPF